MPSTLRPHTSVALAGWLEILLRKHKGNQGFLNAHFFFFPGFAGSVLIQ